jgi:hypothetical protein
MAWIDAARIHIRDHAIRFTVAGQTLDVGVHVGLLRAPCCRCGVVRIEQTVRRFCAGHDDLRVLFNVTRFYSVNPSIASTMTIRLRPEVGDGGSLGAM